MKFIKLYARDDKQAIERAKRFADEQGIISVIAHTTTGDTFLTYAQIHPDGKGLTFETDSWDDDKIGKVALWLYGAVDEVHNHICDILEWFQIVNPNPTEKDKCAQLGAHFEEVSKISQALSCNSSQVRQVSQDFYTSPSIYENSRGNVITLRENWKAELLDALCHQIVTTVGVAHVMGLDIMGALNTLTEELQQQKDSVLCIS